MIAKLVSLVISAGVLAAISACESPTVCTAELRFGVSPADTSLAVGRTFTPRASASGCGGRIDLETDVLWTVEDPSVIDINATSGFIRALKVGQTVVTGTDRGRYHAGPYIVTVRVTQ